MGPPADNTGASTPAARPAHNAAPPVQGKDLAENRKDSNKKKNSKSASRLARKAEAEALKEKLRLLDLAKAAKAGVAQSPHGNNVPAQETPASHPPMRVGSLPVGRLASTAAKVRGGSMAVGKVERTQNATVDYVAATSFRREQSFDPVYAELDLGNTDA